MCLVCRTRAADPAAGWSVLGLLHRGLHRRPHRALPDGIEGGGCGGSTAAAMRVVVTGGHAGGKS